MQIHLPLDSHVTNYFVEAGGYMNTIEMRSPHEYPPTVSSWPWRETRKDSYTGSGAISCQTLWLITLGYLKTWGHCWFCCQWLVLSGRLLNTFCHNTHQDSVEVSQSCPSLHSITFLPCTSCGSLGLDYTECVWGTWTFVLQKLQVCFPSPGDSMKSFEELVQSSKAKVRIDAW